MDKIEYGKRKSLLTGKITTQQGLRLMQRWEELEKKTTNRKDYHTTRIATHQNNYFHYTDYSN